MRIVKVRSPFIIEISQSTQLGSKIELFIWRNGTSEPTTPTYVLSKPIPTTAQRQTYYNVSNLVKEYIDNISTTYANWLSGEANNDWVFFRVKRYWNNAGTYTLLDNIKYVGVNGFTEYMDGLQTTTDSRIKYLFNPAIKQNYLKQDYPYAIDTIQHVDIMIENLHVNDNLRASYNRIDGTTYNYNIDFTGYTGIYSLTIPISLAKLNSNFVNGCRVDLIYTPNGGSSTTQSFYTYPICEPKYTPVLCDFVNRYGGWQTLTFYKAQTNNITAKSDEYKLMSNDVNYNPLRGQSKSFNIKGSQSIKLNTGWVDENYKELIKDLLLSETVLLDKKPVSLKTQSSELKTKLKNRMINYEIDFDYNFNLINDVV